MKNSNNLNVSMLVSSTVLTHPKTSKAQDPLVIAPNVYKKINLENDLVRVIQIEFAPGEIADYHYHPDHIIYVLNGGKLEITDKGKLPQIFELKQGDTVYMSAVIHKARNIGHSTVKLVVTELNQIENQKKKKI
jgi:beta-alanine degradation protein BauB